MLDQLFEVMKGRGRVPVIKQRRPKNIRAHLSKTVNSYYLPFLFWEKFNRKKMTKGLTIKDGTWQKKCQGARKQEKKAQDKADKDLDVLSSTQ